MDAHRIVETLQATFQSEQRAAAEKVLNEMQIVVGFAPTLLQIVLEQSLDLAVRQAAAVFLKNMILKHWKARDNYTLDDPPAFLVQEDDKRSIRQFIVPAIISSVVPIQSILQVAVGKIVKYDFPTDYPNFVEQIASHLNAVDFREIHGALLCVYALTQVYEHRSGDKAPFKLTMDTFLPLLKQRMVLIIGDISDESLALQKLILKIFHCYTNYYLPPNALNDQWVIDWHMLLCSILENFNNSSDDKDGLFWKRQKWAAHILYRWFTTYGCPGNVQKKYETFAEWYLKSFSHQVISTFLKICEAYRQQLFVSPKVMAETLSYFTASLNCSFSWKFLQPNFDMLLQYVIVPLLSHTEEIAELWESDPIEYIRYTTSLYMTFHNPRDAAATFIKDACSKRKGILDKSIQYCIQVLMCDFKPEIKDGALHLVGLVCNSLFKNKVYKDQFESFITAHVLPLFEASEGYRRSRACWLVGKLSRSRFADADVLSRIAMACRHLMCSDPDLPVRVVAAETIFMLIKDQPKVKIVMTTYLPELVMQLLQLLRETELDLNNVLQTILRYPEEIKPISLQMLQHLSETFVKLMGIHERDADPTARDKLPASNDLECDDNNEYQVMVATGVMESIEILVSAIDDNAELVNHFEPVIAHLIHVILMNKVSDFYEEAFSLVSSMTSTTITPLFWTVFDWLYEAYDSDASECFSAMMPALHNYVTIGSESFIASPKRVQMLIAMCKKTIQDENDQSTEGVHAAKMFEVLILNFRGSFDSFLPEFIELALTSLSQESTTIELRVMCLQVIIASIASSPLIVLPILCNHTWPGTQTPIIDNFLRIWMDNLHKFKGLHDRRICVLGLCALLAIRAEQRPLAIDAICAQFLPALLHMLNELKNAYALKKDAENDEDESDESSLDDDSNEEDNVDTVDSDEDVYDAEGSQYLELLECVEAEAGEHGSYEDTDDDDDFDVDSEIEYYKTELDKEECEMDEYVVFYQLMTELENTDVVWYQRLVGGLSESQQSELKELAKVAMNCIESKQSKEIKKAGGYNFQQTDVPSNFNFSGDPPPQA